MSFFFQAMIFLGTSLGNASFFNFFLFQTMIFLGTYLGNASDKDKSSSFHTNSKFTLHLQDRY